MLEFEWLDRAQATTGDGSSRLQQSCQTRKHCSCPVLPDLRLTISRSSHLLFRDGPCEHRDTEGDFLKEGHSSVTSLEHERLTGGIKRRQRLEEGRNGVNATACQLAAASVKERVCTEITGFIDKQLLKRPERSWK